MMELLIDWDVVSNRHTSSASPRREGVTCCVTSRLVLEGRFYDPLNTFYAVPELASDPL